MDLSLQWAQNHLLAIFAVAITLVLAFQYLWEKGNGVKLSKRYRQSVFEAQSKIFLNATQYLISGNKDLAIKEFLNAVDLNRETIDTYFALGGLFRSNGEIEKAISIHRSLIMRDSISENMRVQALKELAIDFDKGGFIGKAIETYKDVLKINRDQGEVIAALCTIFEDIEDWDQAYKYRIMLSKVRSENQSETISHILVQKSKQHFEQGEFSRCAEELEEAFRFAPSVSAKILRLKLHLIQGSIDDAKSLFNEVLLEHPMYSSFLFVSLNEGFVGSDSLVQSYNERLKILQDYFLELDERELLAAPSAVLSKIRLLKSEGRVEEAYDSLSKWMEADNSFNQVIKVEFIKLLITMEKMDEVVVQTESLLNSLDRTVARHFCSQCGFDSDDIFWRCPKCKVWETIQFRWKV